MNFGTKGCMYNCGDECTGECIKVETKTNMIKLKELRDWIDTLPKEFLEFDVVNAEEGILTEDGEVFYRFDKPVVSLNVDVDNQEILILNQNKDE